MLRSFKASRMAEKFLSANQNALTEHTTNISCFKLVKSFIMLAAQGWCERDQVGIKASSNWKTLFIYSVLEYILGAHSCKKAVQRVNLVEKILDQTMRDRERREWGWEQSKQRVARLLVTKFREKYLSNSQPDILRKLYFHMLLCQCFTKRQFRYFFSNQL